MWAAGVTYKRSKVAREEESHGAAQFYDKVYTADRPELFFKATPERVVGPGRPVRIRRDSKWSVPEPELALMVSPDLRIVGYTVGNDMSSRDIEGENPLYLPQAKVYDGVVRPRPGRDARRRDAAAAGRGHPPDHHRARAASPSRGPRPWARWRGSLESLVEWLGRENEFPAARSC